MADKGKKIKKTLKINYRILAVVLSILFAVAVIALIKNSSSNSDGKLVGYVNGKKIYDNEILSFLDELYGIPDNFNLDIIPKEQKIVLMEQLYTETAILKKAKKLNLERDKEIAKKIKQSKAKIIKEEYLNHISENAVSREKIEELYNNHATSLEGQEEVKASHILVKTKEEALDIAKQLGSKSFTELAQAKSIDNYSKEKGGDLGYFTKGRMIKEFEDKVFNMEIGAISSPFETKYGWHIVKLEDKRKAAVPTFDEMHEKLKREIKFQAINNHINEIKAEMNVELADDAKTVEKTESETTEN